MRGSIPAAPISPSTGGPRSSSPCRGDSPRRRRRLGTADPAQRIAEGQKSFEEINLIGPPSGDSPYFYAGILNYVFGHLWLRPGLSRRDRRMITIPCVGVSDAIGPIWSHVTSAMGSGDVSYDEMREIILQFSAYAGMTRARVMLDVADQWQATQQ